MVSLASRAGKGFSPAGSVTAGLLLFHLLAFPAVYGSNVRLLATLGEISDAGYLAVPAGRAMKDLGNLGSAFFGAFFFTLTLGAGLCLAALGAAWAWDHLFNRRRYILLLFVIPWIAAVYAFMKHDGLTMLGTISTVLVPPLVFGTAAIGYRGRPAFPSLARFSPLACLPVAAVPWFVLLLSGDSFTCIRDNLLGRSTAGIVLVEGYYRYTLYPAHVMQSLEQRLQKTCRLEGFDDPKTKRTLKETLVAREYLVLKKCAASVDLVIRYRGEDTVSLDNGLEPVTYAGLADFMLRPDVFLSEYSNATDRRLVLRYLVFFCLLWASPLLLYLVLLKMFRWAAELFHLEKEEMSIVIASVLCLVTGTGLLVLSLVGPSPPEGQLRQSLVSTVESERVTALRVVHERGLDMVRELGYGGYGTQAVEMPPLERYWLARALRHSRDESARADLLRLAEDKWTVVSTMAFRSLSHRRRPDMVPEILSRLETNKHWYSQLEAYRTLRMNGWRQELPRDCSF